MGNIFSITSQHYQTHDNECDICKSKEIFIRYYFEHRQQGSIYYICNNNHRFYVNTFGQTYEDLHFYCKKFKKYDN